MRNPKELTLENHKQDAPYNGVEMEKSFNTLKGRISTSEVGTNNLGRCVFGM